MEAVKANPTPGGIIFIEPGQEVAAPKQENPVPLSESDSILGMITRAQADPAVDVSKLERLFDLYERAKARQAEEEYNEAVLRVKAKMPRITKNKKVMYDIEKGKPEKGQEEAFSYAPLEKIDEIVAPLLLAEHLRIKYTTEHREGGGAVVIGTLKHNKGYLETCAIPLPLDTSGGKNNIQGMGSTFSYGCRYTLCGLLNIVVIGADDDAQSLTTITEEKVKELEERLVKVGADMKAFLQFMKVEKLEDILKKDLAKGENMLKAKERKKEKK